MFAFRTRHKELVCKMGERFSEKDYSRTQEGKLVEHDPEAAGEKNGVRAIKRGLERKGNVFTFWGDRGAARGWVKMKPQGNWGTKTYGGLNWPSALIRGCHSSRTRIKKGSAVPPPEPGRYRQMEVGGQDRLVALASGFFSATANDVPIHLESQLPLFQVSAVDLDRPQNIFLLRS